MIKLQTFPHLMVLCHVSAFLHSSPALPVSLSRPKFHFNILYVTLCLQQIENKDAKASISKADGIPGSFFFFPQMVSPHREHRRHPCQKLTIFLKRLTRYNRAIIQKQCRETVRLLIILPFSCYLSLPLFVSSLPCSSVFRR